ncbi:helix-turn-helix protein [Bacteroidales bacterium Barb6]|nr:helix-turn-helix protein [Bacteroidales bacterium Barb6]
MLIIRLCIFIFIRVLHYIDFAAVKLYTYMDFRKGIKESCRHKGITQKDLADKLGITDISLNKTLRGDYPQLQSLEKIAIALEVDISELFTPSKDNDTIACPYCGNRIKTSKE